MIFYKYCQPDRREPLLNQTLRITQFIHLNDLFDCLPVAILNENDLDDYRLDTAFKEFEKNGGDGGRDGVDFQTFAKQYPEMERKSKDRRSREPKEDQRTRDRNKGFQEGFSERGGVICLSERADSLLMWSHYAERHQGYAIGVDPALLEIPNVQGHGCDPGIM